MAININSIKTYKTPDYNSADRAWAAARAEIKDKVSAAALKYYKIRPNFPYTVYQVVAMQALARYAAVQYYTNSTPTGWSLKATQPMFDKVINAVLYS